MKHQDYLHAFGKALRAQRAFLGISQRDLAARSGLSRGTIERIEAGYGTSLTSITLLCETLQMYPSDLLICSEYILENGES